MTLRGGVHGFGNVGQAMTRLLNREKKFGADARIVAVCNRGKEKRDLAEREYGLKTYERLDDLLGHGLDFVLILSQSHVHKEVALQCVRARLPYLIEKPIALSVPDALEIVEATERAGLINGVNYTMRYQPLYRKMKQLVENGTLGEVLTVWARSFRGHGFYASGKRHRAIVDPAESGGWIVHHMCHIVDFVIWIAGEVEEVYCVTKGTAPAELAAEEINWATLKFKSGALGCLGDQIGMLRDHSSGVIGTKAGVSEMPDGFKKLLKLCYETDIEFAPPHVIDPSDDFQDENGLGHFLRCLREGRQTEVPVREAWYSLKVCHALRRSTLEGLPIRVDAVG